MKGLQVHDLAFQGRGPYSFRLAPGTVTGLHGVSGAGKSLLLRAMADLDVHDGEVILNGTACASIPARDWRQMVGMLPAESFWWFDTVGEHFRGPADTFESLLARLGFPAEVLGWQVSRLSTGEKQRLAIVRLLQNSPRALLLDEPTASLDAANIERTEQLLLDYCRSEQVPLLWVSHDPDQLQRVADRIFFLDSAGKLLPEEEATHGR
jgi:ABC-type iron transport system FetAB ATPase subunit